MITIGLTGGICSGKSNVREVLKRFGADVLDADLIGHSVYAPGTIGFDRVVAAFGPDVVSSDGSIDRRTLGAKVFQNAHEMAKLTGIVWPLIAEHARKGLEELRSKHVKMVVLEAAVLIEAGWKELVDEVWVTVVPVEVAIERMAKRNKFTREEAQLRLDRQMTNEDRIKHAHVVIDTNGTFEQTEEKLNEEWKKLQQRSLQRQQPSKVSLNKGAEASGSIPSPSAEAGAPAESSKRTASNL